MKYAGLNDTVIEYGPMDPNTSKRKVLSKKLSISPPDETVFEQEVRYAKAAFEAFDFGDIKWEYLGDDEKRSWLNVVEVIEKLTLKDNK